MDSFRIAGASVVVFNKDVVLQEHDRVARMYVSFLGAISPKIFTLNAPFGSSCPLCL